jgi:hypothetical protein
MKSNRLPMEETKKLQQVWNNYIKIAKPPNDYNSTQQVTWLDETIQNFLDENGLESLSTKTKVGFYTYKEDESYLIIIDRKKWMLAKLKFDI